MTMAYAYGRLTPRALIRHVVVLPRGARPLVEPGQQVRAMEPVATAQIRGEHHILNIGKLLRLPPQRAEASLQKLQGDFVEQGELLARRRRFLRKPLEVHSPISGQVLQADSGMILLEGASVTRDVHTPIPGRVTHVQPGVYVVVETVGVQIELAWGWGGLGWGPLRTIGEKPELELKGSGHFTIDHRGAIVAISAPLTEALLAEAMEIRVKGLIAASATASLLPAIREVDFPVALTRGFGTMPMNVTILAMLRANTGRQAALDAGRSGDWRRNRPEIIIPLEAEERSRATLPAESPVFAEGQQVRVLQHPHMGAIGTIRSIPDQPRRLDSGLWAAGAMVQVSSDETIFVPFLNLEYLD